MTDYTTLLAKLDRLAQTEGDGLARECAEALRALSDEHHKTYILGLHSLLALAQGNEVGTKDVTIISASDFPRHLFLPMEGTP